MSPSMFLGLVSAAGAFATAILASDTDGALDAIADEANALLETYVPAYAVAATACGIVPACNARLVQLRRELVREIADPIGLTAAIKALERLARLLPVQDRAEIMAAGKTAVALKRAFSHPSWATIYSLAGDAVSLVDQSIHTAWTDVVASLHRAVHALFWTAVTGADITAALMSDTSDCVRGLVSDVTAAGVSIAHWVSSVLSAGAGATGTTSVAQGVKDVVSLA